jgi:hypothetical protein
VSSARKPPACRPGCAACCEAISISSPLPGQPGGKAAGAVCGLLDPHTRFCTIWQSPDYPEVCRRFTPDPQYCGSCREEALERLRNLERQTRPER